jgi:hypothetical protein
MAARIIKVVGLVVLAAALSAPFASAKPYLNTPALDQGMQGPAPSTSTYLNTPALDQGMQSTVVTPNDRAGNQGIGQNSTDFGMGGRYGQNLITDAQAAKTRDLQRAKSFRLPLAPDDRAGTVQTPYLSLGIGVDASRSYGGAIPTVIQSTPTVIPYLSHGIGVNPAQFSGSPVSPDNRSGMHGAQPSTPGNGTYDVGGVLQNPNAAPTSFAAPVSTSGDGFSWSSAGIGAAGLAAIALAIGLLVVLGRRSRHEGVAVS